MRYDGFGRIIATGGLSSFIEVVVSCFCSESLLFCCSVGASVSWILRFNAATSDFKPFNSASFSTLRQ